MRKRQKAPKQESACISEWYYRYYVPTEGSRSTPVAVPTHVALILILGVLLQDTPKHKGTVRS
jgi:hypothetical protein